MQVFQWFIRVMVCVQYFPSVFASASEDTMSCEHFDQTDSIFTSWYAGCKILNVTFEKYTELPDLSLNGNILTVMFENSRLYTIPRIIFSAMPNMKILHADHSDIEKINFDFITPAPLEILTLKDNNIAQLEKNTFRGVPSLQLIDLSYNQIINIAESTFKNLRYLVDLVLSHNFLTVLHPNIFSNQAELATTFLDNNQLWHLDVNTFRETLKLQEIHLESNRLSVLNSSKIFENTRSLSYINLSHNQISELSEYIFTNCPLIDIDLSYNKLSKINTNFFAADTEATSIYLDYNQIVSIESSTLVSGQMISLTNNNITELGQLNFTGFHNLHSINLAMNPLQLKHSSLLPLAKVQYLNLNSVGLNMLELGYGLFMHSKDIVELDISNNGIHRINLKSFQAMKSLEVLNLQGNDLTEIDDFKLVRQILPQFRFIDLANNNWNCTYLSDLTHTLLHLGITMPVEDVEKAGKSNVLGIECHTNETTFDFEASKGDSIATLIEWLREQKVDNTKNLDVLKNVTAALSLASSLDEKKSSWLLVAQICVLTLILLCLAFQTYRRYFNSSFQRKTNDDSISGQNFVEYSVLN